MRHQSLGINCNSLGFGQISFYYYYLGPCSGHRSLLNLFVVRIRQGLEAHDVRGARAQVVQGVVPIYNYGKLIC